LTETLSERLAGIGYRLGWKAIPRVPEPLARWAFTQTADIAWRRQGRGVRQLEANLERVLPPGAGGKDLRALSPEAMHSYARYWLEAFRLQTIPPERILSGMHIEGPGEQAAFGHMKLGRGVIFALPHTGNVEQAAAWINLRGAGGITTVSSVARRRDQRSRAGERATPPSGSKAA
jgi:phosphatidylinositol dimannoside acyltransferase